MKNEKQPRERAKELGCFVKAKGRGPSKPEGAVGCPALGRSAAGVRCDLSGLPVGTWAKEGGEQMERCWTGIP